MVNNPKNKTILILTAIFLVGLGYAVYATFMPFYGMNDNSFQDSAEITVEGDTIHYVGDIGPSTLEEFQNITQTLTTPPKTLKINSGGGEVVAGMTIARYVADNNMDVEVYDMCFSSCANYIFMAGREKRIHDGTILGWHGDGTSTTSIMAKTKQKQIDMLRDGLSKHYDGDELETMVNQQWQDLFVDQPKAEAQFYTDYNINHRAIRYGHTHKPTWEKLDALGAKYVGWTFSPAVMEQLGIKNIKLVTGKWYPSERDGMKLLYIDKLQD